MHSSKPQQVRRRNFDTELYDGTCRPSFPFVKWIGELIEAMGGAIVDIKNDMDIDISVSFKPKVPTEQEFLPMADISVGDEGFECFDNDIFESLKTYQEKKKYFEIFHFLVLTPTPKYYHLYWKDEGYGGRLEFNDWNAKTDLNTAYRNRFFIEMVKTEKEVKGEKIEKYVPKKVKFVETIN
jgi:hypothetical protein